MSISNLFDNKENKALEVEKATYEAFIQSQYGKEPTGKGNFRRDDNDSELGNYGSGDTRASRSSASLPLPLSEARDALQLVTSAAHQTHQNFSNVPAIFDNYIGPMV
ncbi:hypothetical protein HL42_6463 [Trichophyton rubrum]|nr:hypothetical protein HL42_6463 [Trichophyton rubrum]